MKILVNSDDSVGASLEEAARSGTWQQQMKWAIRDISELGRKLNLPESTITSIGQSVEQFSLFAPLPYLSRIEPGQTDDPLLLQVLPQAAEDISPPDFSNDPLGEQAATIDSGLLKKYRKRVLVIASGACAINCRYCFRRHFPYETSPKSDSQWEATIEKVESDESINEVILSGGDPLVLIDDKLESVFNRLNSIKHLRRIRIHTRLPVVIPQRVTDRFIEILDQSRLQVFFVVHINHPNEIDDFVAQQLGRIRTVATGLLNQSVLLKKVNDDAEVLIALSERLLDVGVLPYYLHQLDEVTGTSHFQVDVEQGRAIIKEMRAHLPGYAVPRYVKEIAGQPNKTVLA
jgi:EF-P beta-lysylation protein EpmB